MLTKEEFEDSFSKLEINFNKISNQTTKNFFYSEFQHMTLREWISVCQDILDEEEFFPKKSTFIKHLQKYKKKSKKEDCTLCDGYGWVYDHGNKMYRAKCKHGDTLSKEIPYSSNGATPAPKTLETDVDRSQFFKGIKFLEVNNIKVPSFVKKKCEVPF